PRERRMQLLHLLLDEGVTRLPHHGLEPGALELPRQDLRALHVEDDASPAPAAAGEIAAQQHQELVTEQSPPPLVDRADPVAVAVERDPELGALAPHRRLQVAQV